MANNGKKKQTPKTQLVVAPGPSTLQGFLTNNADLLNLTEVERYVGLPNSTLRHIRTGRRSCTPATYAVMRELLLPRLCELVFILQNYDGKLIQKELGY